MTVLALAIAWNVSPLAYSLARNGGDVTAQAKTWSPRDRVPAQRTSRRRTASRRSTPSTHSAAVYLADAQIPLARGWYRQDDFPQNELLYDDDLGPKAYLALAARARRPLRRAAARDAGLQLERRGCARAQRARRARPVFHTRELTIYAVPHARSIITGPGIADAHVADAVADRRRVVRRGGTYRIAVRWSPYWHASLGCLAKGKDEMIRLTTRRAHFVRLTFRVNAARALDEIVGQQPTLHGCL